MHIELFEQAGALYSRTEDNGRTVLAVMPVDAAWPWNTDNLPEYHPAAIYCPACDYPTAPDYTHCVACGAEWEA